MTRNDLLKLRPGATVIHKKTGFKFRFAHTCKAWDGVPPNQRNERPAAVCEKIPGLEYDSVLCGVGRGPFFYFEAKEISVE